VFDREIEGFKTNLATRTHRTLYGDDAVFLNSRAEKNNMNGEEKQEKRRRK
jgi:hypothetical protein